MSSDGWTVTAGWSGVTATAEGSAHRDGRSNQDAAGVVPLSDGGMAAAVADGHGGATHGRSDVGARLAVEAALAVVREEAATSLSACFPAIVDRWRSTVREHQADQPVTPGVDIYRPYGTTLLVAVARAGRLSLAQLGDGDIIVKNSTAAHRPVPGDPSLAADTTTSLCLPTAVADARFAEVEVDPRSAALVVLATDGLGKSFEDARWWETTVEDYAVLLDQLGPDAFARELGSWLGDSAVVAGDDTTVALMHWPPGGPGSYDEEHP